MISRFPDTRITVLGELIKRIRHGNEDNYVLCITELPDERYIDIYSEVFEEDICNRGQLDISIILSCIKKVMINWKHYFGDGDLSSIHGKLIRHITKNVNYLLSLKDQAVQYMEDNDPDRIIAQVTCPVRKYKTIFYQVINPDNEIINDKNSVFRDAKASSTFISSKDITNWPNIAVSILFTNFHLVHCNLPQSKFELIKFDADYRPKTQARCTELRYKSLTEDRRTLNTKAVTEYVDHIKQYVRMNPNIRIGKKVDLLSILTEIKQDIELCTDSIDTDTEYYAPTSKYSYARYLGQPDSGEVDQPSISVEDQIKIVENKTNIRMKETVNPVTKFIIKKFDVKFELLDTNKYKFAEEEETIPALRNCLTYECLLCSKTFSSMMATEEVGRHIIHTHGPEPDWLCVKCGKSYSTRKLSCERWNHSCPSKKVKKKKAM